MMHWAIKIREIAWDTYPKYDIIKTISDEVYNSTERPVKNMSSASTIISSLQSAVNRILS